MSVTFTENTVYLKDKSTGQLLPVGVFGSGADESLEEIKNYADEKVSEAKEAIEEKKQEAINAVPDVVEAKNMASEALSKATAMEGTLFSHGSSISTLNDTVNEILPDLTQTKADLSELDSRLSESIIQMGETVNSIKNNTYTKIEIDTKLSDYVTYVPITIDCKGTDDSTPKPVTISVLEEGSGEVYQTINFYGTPVVCRVPKGFAYLIKGSDDLDNYYSPISVHGEAVEPTSVIIRYSVLGIIESYRDIQKVVQVGKARNVFEIEDQIEVATNGDFGNLQFDVVDFDNVHKETDSNEKTMNLLLHDVLYGYQLGAVQAMIACTKGLQAGTYNFNLPTTYGSWVAGNYQFATSRDVPEGGQLKLSNASGNTTSITDLSLQMYESPKATQIMETVGITSGTDGIDLGTLGDGYAKYNGVFLNHWQRIAYGSNNYEQSAIDQWLNAIGRDWWKPACMFDRPPLYVNQLGFLGQLDSEFVDVLGEVCVKTHTNTVYEAPDAPHPTNTIYELSRKIYLVSRREVFDSSENATLADGSKQYAYYSTRTQNADRIKYDHVNKTTARTWWLRTPYSGNASLGRICYSSGAMDINSSYGGYGAVPACTII